MESKKSHFQKWENKQTNKQKQKPELVLISHFISGKTKKLGEGRVESSKRNPSFLILEGEVDRSYFTFNIDY